MTVPVSARRSGPYTAVGGETTFAYAFKLLAAADLAVWRRRGGASLRLTLGTDYQVTGVANPAGGSVILTTAALADDLYVLEGARANSRLTDVVSGQTLHNSLINSEYDSLQVQVVETARDLGRAIARSRFDATGTTELPPATAGYLIGFDDDGNLAAVPPGDGVGGGVPDPLPIEMGGTGASAAAAARDNLGVVASSALGVSVATLTDGTLTPSQIPPSITSPFRFRGTWNATSNATAPVGGGAAGSLASSVGSEGDLWRVSVAGTTALDGEADWAAGDEAYYGGGLWSKLGGAAVGGGGVAGYALDGRVKLHGTVNGFGGSKYQVAVTEDERLLLWGDSASLGFSSSDRYAAYQVPLPWDTDSVTIAAVYCGLNYILVRTDEASNNLWHLGSSAHGQGGDGSTDANTVLTRCSLSGITVTDVTTEAAHGETNAFWFAVTSLGRIYSCGYSGAEHVMGYNNTANLLTPRLMTYADGATPITLVAKVYASGSSVPVWARLTTGAAVRWGDGTTGAHGDNSSAAMTWPNALETSHGSGVDRTDVADIAVCGGAVHANTWLLTTAGKIEVSGQREYGNGDGSALAGAAITTFQPAAGAIAALTVTKIVAGGGGLPAALAITSTGHGYIVGYVVDGLIGNGGTVSVSTFTILSGLPSGFAGALTNAAIGGGGVASIYTNMTLYIEATISGEKFLASIGEDGVYQSGKGTTGVAAAAMTWGLVLGGRGDIASWYTFGTANSAYGLGVLDSDGQLWYAGGNDQGQSGTGQPLAAAIDVLQPVQTGVPVLLKPPTLRGAYSALTTYTFNDEATEQGATWRLVSDLPSTGNAPPTLPTESNSYWRAVSLPGVDGVSINWQGAWLTATGYAVQDGAENDGSSYICTSAHTSGASTEPGVGASWATVWDLAAAKGAPGIGDMLAANNLGDLASAATARTNLGLGNSATESLASVRDYVHLDASHGSGEAIDWMADGWAGPAGATGISNGSIVANRIYALPIVLPKSRTVTTLGFRLNTAGAASSKVRLALHASSATGQPGVQLFASAELAVDGAAAQITAALSVALSAGVRYWLLITSNGAPAISGATGSAAGGATLGYVFPSGTTPASQAFARRDVAYGAIPADESGETYANAGALFVPYVFVK